MLRAFSTSKSGASALAVAAFSTYFVLKKLVSWSKQQDLEKERAGRLIIITGCDSGLGYSMAVWAGKLGYKIIAACLNENGEGAQKLKRQFRDQIIVAGVNVTDASNLENFHALCREILATSEGKLRLWAVITNAAVCTMGEFFWQTQRQRQQQMDVNYWGTVNLISEMRSLLLEQKTRVIVISSDCSEYPLPFLSAYSASKSALNAWAQSFRFEVAKYGIHVAAYQPRGFLQHSGLFSNFQQQYEQMVTEMTASEKNYYGDYFEKFMNTKQEIFAATRNKPIKPLNTNQHRKSFVFLLEGNIKSISVHRDFSWMEKIFHALYKALPQGMVDQLVVRLLNEEPKTVYWKEPEAKQLSF